jgi:hypothetical protein
MNYDTKAILGWALPMFTIPAMPVMATLVAEPSVPLVLAVAAVIAIASGFVGSLFTDEK